MKQQAKRSFNMVKYVVTDPCYLLNDELWSKCCKHVRDWAKFNELVEKCLYMRTGYPAYVCETGFGDWTNRLYGENVTQPEFFADSGMVCVCRLTPHLEEHLQNTYQTDCFIGAAVFEASENIEVKFNRDDIQWTVVEIKDKETGNFIKSMDPMTDEDEDE